MKLTFFLIALALILLRLCYPTMEIWRNGREQGTMITESDNYHEGIYWSGKYRLSDDDRQIAEISPGGYLKFRENDTTMKVESDLQGKLSYSLYNGRTDLPLNDSGRNFVAAQLQKMIRLGFFAEERAERIDRQGGVPALLAELSRIGIQGDRDSYLKRVLAADSLTVPQRIELLRLGNQSNDNGARQHLLEVFTRDQLSDSAVAREWLTSVGHLDASYEKKDLLKNHLDSSLTIDQFDTVLAITTRFGSDIDEQDVYKELLDLPQLRKRDSAYAVPWLHAVGQLDPSYMKKDLLLNFLGKDTSAGLPPAQFDSVLTIATRFGSDVDEQEIFERLAEKSVNNDAEWTMLIQKVGVLNEDYIKTDLLLKIAPKMPRTDSVQAAYKAAARTIHQDEGYGKVMRALD